jgi:hypothetical protein
VHAGVGVRRGCVAAVQLWLGTAHTVGVFLLLASFSLLRALPAACCLLCAISRICTISNAKPQPPPACGHHPHVRKLALCMIPACWPAMLTLMYGSVPLSLLSSSMAAKVKEKREKLGYTV